MKKLLAPLIGVAVTVGVLWVAKELKGLGSIEFGILDGDDPDEEEDAAQVPLTFWEDLQRDLRDPKFAERFREEMKYLTGGSDAAFSKYFDLLAEAPPVDLREHLLDFKRYLDDAEDDRAAEQFEADVVTQTGMSFEDWIQSPEIQKALSDPEECSHRRSEIVVHLPDGVDMHQFTSDAKIESSPLEEIQHFGDYADVVGGGALTLADLEGLQVPDLTAIAEDLKRDTMDPVDKSIVDIVSTLDTTDPASLHEQRMMSLDRDVVDDAVIDEPVSQTGFSTDQSDYLGDGPYKGYLLSEANHLSQGSPRLRQPAPSPTAEAPGDVSTVWEGVIKDAVGIEPESYNVQLANQPKD